MQVEQADPASRRADQNPGAIRGEVHGHDARVVEQQVAVEAAVRAPETSVSVIAHGGDASASPDRDEHLPAVRQSTIGHLPIEHSAAVGDVVCSDFAIAVAQDDGVLVSPRRRRGPAPELRRHHHEVLDVPFQPQSVHSKPIDVVVHACNLTAIGREATREQQEPRCRIRIRIQPTTVDTRPHDTTIGPRRNERPAVRQPRRRESRVLVRTRDSGASCSSGPTWSAACRPAMRWASVATCCPCHQARQPASRSGANGSS